MKKTKKNHKGKKKHKQKKSLFDTSELDQIGKDFQQKIGGTTHGKKEKKLVF
jgi:hypothetical protein